MLNGELLEAKDIVPSGYVFMYVPRVVVDPTVVVSNEAVSFKSLGVSTLPGPW